MDITILSIASVGLATVVFVGWPLLRPLAARDADTEKARQRRLLLDEKERLLADLKDLELSLETGKISQEDYQPLVDQTKRDAARVLQQLDALGIDAPAEDGGGAPETASALSCASCGAEYEASDAFCRKCGAKTNSE